MVISSDNQFVKPDTIIAVDSSRGRYLLLLYLHKDERYKWEWMNYQEFNRLDLCLGVILKKKLRETDSEGMPFIGF